MVERNKLSSWGITLSLILLLVATLIIVFGIVHYSIEKVNEEARITNENHVKAVIKDRLNQKKNLAKDYAFWDDTIKNAYLSQNPKWIKENVGEYLTDTFKVTDLFIINGHDEAVLSLKDGQANNLNFSTINKDALTALAVSARQSGTIPVPVSGMIMINGAPAIVGMSVLAPEDGTSLPSPRPLLLVARRLDPSYLQELADQYRLRGLQFIQTDKKDSAKGFIKLTNPLSNNLGLLTWYPDKPGDLVLAKIQTPILLLLVIIIIVIAFIINASRNITRNLENAYKDLAFNANHDVLTGLANRRLFNELLIQAIHTAKRDNIVCAILYIDLDDFKKVNDVFGHKAGDHLLVATAERIKSSVRESDAIARIGGDEFIVLLHGINDNDDIKATAQKIMESLKQPILVNENTVQVSASIGIAVIPNDGADSDVLMSRADLALYGCKNQGRNAFQFYGDLS